MADDQRSRSFVAANRFKVERSSPKSPSRSPRRLNSSSSNKRKNDHDDERSRSSRSSRSSANRRSASPSPRNYKRLHSGEPQYARKLDSEDDSEDGEDGEFDKAPPADHSYSDDRWVSSYRNGGLAAAKYPNDSQGDSANNYLFNSFKTLVKANKLYIDTDDVVAIFVCNLMSSTQDVFLYSNHSKLLVQPNKNFVNTSICLAVTSKGCKFKPAFLRKQVEGSPLVNEQLVQMENWYEWLQNVFKSELETNAIHGAICVTENEDLYQDEKTRELFGQMDCQLVLVPNSLAVRCDPFEHSILLALNGLMNSLLHDPTSSNKQCPTSLAESLAFFENAWDRLSDDEIRNAFNSTIMKMFD